MEIFTLSKCEACKELVEKSVGSTYTTMMDCLTDLSGRKEIHHCSTDEPGTKQTGISVVVGARERRNLSSSEKDWELP